MRYATVIGVLATLLMVAPPLEAQQSLGDVAGSIKLKRPEGESVVIDQNTIGQTRRVRRGGTTGDVFLETVADCLTETRAIHALLVEARDGSTFYQNEWRGRVGEAGLRFDTVRDELGRISVDDGLTEAYDLADQGANSTAAGLQILRGAIAEDRPVYSQARVLCEEAMRLFAQADKAAGAASRANAATSAPEPINPIDADRAMSALCAGRAEPGSPAYDSCVDRQRSAVDAMNARSWAGIGIDEPTFNSIRNNCRFEWRGDFVSQDRCEQQRIAAKTGR